MADDKYTFKGSDNTLDLSEFDKLGTDDFKYTDPSDTNTKHNRSPITQTKRDLSSGLRAASDTFIPAFRQRLEYKLPKSASLLNEGMTFVSDLNYMKNDLTRDIAPSIMQLKRSGQQLAPKVKAFLPEFAHKYYDKLVSTDDDHKNASINKEKEEDRVISSTIESVLGQQIKTSLDLEASRRQDNVVDRALAGNRHQQTFEQLKVVRAGSEFQMNFVRQVQLPYMRKDLELKLRHLFVSREIRDRLKNVSTIMEAKLDDIRHNTALPEIQKLTKAESVKEVVRNRIANSVTNWGKTVLNKIKTQVFDPFKDGLAMLGDASEMYTSAVTDEDPFGESAGPQTRLGVISRAAGKGLGAYAANKLVGSVFGNKLLGIKANNIEELSKTLRMRAMLKMQDLATRNEDSVLGMIYSLFSPDLRRDTGYTTNSQLNDPNSPSAWRSKDSIALTTIIPGLLSKQLQQLTILTTGNVNTPELVYDTKTQDFITTTQFQKQFAEEAFGSRKERQAGMAAALGNIRGTINVNNADELKSFDELMPDMAKFLMNQAISKHRFNYELLHKTAEQIRGTMDANPDLDVWDFDKERFDNAYLKAVFQGVKHPAQLLLMIDSLVYAPDGTVDKLMVSTIVDAFQKYIIKDDYQKAFSKYESLGMMRHLSPYTTAKGGVFKHNDRVIRDIYAGIDPGDEDFTSALDSATTYRANYVSKNLRGEDEDITSDVPPGLAKRMYTRVLDWMYSPEQRQSAFSSFKSAVMPYVPNAVIRTFDKISPKVRLALEDYNKKIAELPSGAQFDVFKDLDTEEEETAISVDQDGIPNRLKGPWAAKSGKGEVSLLTSIRNGIYSIRDILDQKVIKTSIQGTVPQALTPAPVSTVSADTSGVVTSVDAFHASFKEYVKSQDTVKDILSAIMASTARTVDSLAEMRNSIFGITTGDVKTWYSSVVSKVKGAGKFAWNMTSGYYKTLAKVPGTLMRGAKSLWETKGKDLANRAWDWWKEPGIFSKAPEKIKAAVSTGVDMGRAGARMASQSLKRKIWVDIYRKDEIDAEKPLLTAKTQMDGVYFANGRRVLTSWEINEPVKNKDGDITYITAEDVEHGLVDVHNKRLSDNIVSTSVRGAKSLIGKGLKGVKKLLDPNGILGLYKNLMETGLKLGAGVLGKMGDFLGGGFGFGNKKVVDRLDTIILILKKKFGYSDNDLKAIGASALLTSEEKGETAQPTSEGARPGDADGDGKRDTIFEARKRIEQDKEDKKEKKERTSLVSSLKKMATSMTGDGKKKGFLGKVLGLLGGVSAVLGSMFRGVMSVGKAIVSGVGLLGKLGLGSIRLVGNIAKLLMMAVPGIGKGLSWGLDFLGDAFKGKNKLGRFGRAAMTTVKELGGSAMSKLVSAGAATSGLGGSIATGAASKAAGIAAKGGFLRGAAALGLRALGGGAGLLLRGAGALLGGPVGWAMTAGMVGQYLLAETETGRKLTNWLGVTKNDFQMERAKLYGINVSGTTSHDTSPLRSMVQLEERTLTAITSRKPLTDDDLREFARKFLGDVVNDVVEGGEANINPITGLPMGPSSSESPDAVVYFTAWYKRRFIPIFTAFFKILQKENVQYSDVDESDSITPEQRQKLLAAMRTAASGTISGQAGLMCTPDGFMQYKKLLEKERKDAKTLGEKDRAAAARAMSKDKQRTDAANKATGSKLTTNRDSASLHALDAVSKDTSKLANSQTGLDLTTLTDGKGNALFGDASDYADLEKLRNGGIDPTKGGMMGGPQNAGSQNSAFDTSNLQIPKISPSSLPGMDGLGEYVAKWESGNRGSSAIGWDTTGGTSYGKYQVAAMRGSAKQFVDWMAKNGGDFGKKFAEAMYQANGNARPAFETGGKTGPTVDVWKKFAQDPNFGRFEHEFIKQNHYQQAYNKLSPELRQLVDKDRGMQEALWSSSIQHGAAGAASMWAKSFKPGMSAQDFLKTMYSNRGNYFSKSSEKERASVRNRFKEELPIVLGLSQQQSPLSTDGSAPTAATGQDGTMPTVGGPSNAASGGDAVAASGGSGAGGGGEGAPTIPTDMNSAGMSTEAGGGNGAKSGIQLPSPSPVVTSPFGPRNVPGGSKNHKGIDLRAHAGEPIKAMDAGIVEQAGGKYGAVAIKHDSATASKYLHMSQIGVQPGQQVGAGDVIGRAGGTGPNGPNQYTPHLHFEVLKNGTNVDPEAFLKSAGINISRKGGSDNPTMAPQSDADAPSASSGSPKVSDPSAMDNAASAAARPNPTSSAPSTDGAVGTPINTQTTGGTDNSATLESIDNGIKQLNATLSQLVQVIQSNPGAVAGGGEQAAAAASATPAKSTNATAQLATPQVNNGKPNAPVSLSRPRKRSSNDITRPGWTFDDD